MDSRRWLSLNSGIFTIFWLAPLPCRWENLLLSNPCIVELLNPDISFIECQLCFVITACLKNTDNLHWRFTGKNVLKSHGRMFHSFYLLSTINEFSKKSIRSWSSSVFSISFRGIQNGLWQVEINRCYLGMLLACLLHDWQKEEIEKIQLIKSVRATKYAWLWFIDDTKLRGVGDCIIKLFYAEICGYVYQGQF